MPKVLIVDDSPTARLALTAALRASPDIEVVGEAATGAEALRLVRELDPDLLTMDVYLRHESGIEVTAAVMAATPRPILLVTGVNPDDAQVLYAAMQAGALDVFPKLPSPRSPGYPAARAQLIRVVKALAMVPVVGRHQHQSATSTTAPAPSSRPESRARGYAAPPAAVLIGASTGGPPALATILEGIPAPCPVPILIVQHISMGFGAGLANWLGDVSGHRVAIVDAPVVLQAGHVYLPADGSHLRFIGADMAAPSQEDAGPHRPSLDVLFASAAEHLQARALAAIMTGMGSDGAEGMLALWKAGACTLAQAPGSCAVDSMPRSAIERGAIELVLTPEELAVHIAKAVVGTGPAAARQV